MSSLDDYISELAVQQQKTNALASTLTEARDTNPDEFARMKKLSEQAAIDMTILPDFKKEAEQAAYLQDMNIGKLWETAPKTANALVNPTVAGMAHDDVQNLSALEQAMSATGNFLAGTGKSLTAGLLFRPNAGAYGVLRAGADLLPDVVGDPIANFAAKYSQVATQTANALTPQTDNRLLRNWYSGVNSLGSNAAALAVYVASGGTVNPLVTMGAQEFGTSYQDARSKGKSGWEGGLYAASNAAIEVGTEQMSVGPMLKMFKPGTQLGKAILEYTLKEQGGEQIATHLQDLNEWAALNPEKTFGDYLRERPGAALDTAMSTLVSSGLQSGAAKIVQKVVSKTASIDEADKGAQKLANAMALAAQSKLRERSPETFQQLVETMTEGPDGKPQSVFIDANVLLQSATPEQLVEILPSVAEQLQDSATANGTLEVSIGEALTALPGTPLEQVFLQNARSAPDALSLADATQAAEQAEAFLAQEAERVMQQASDKAAWQQSAEAVKTTIKQQLDAAGRFTPDVNDAYATLQQHFFSSMAARLGITPQEMYDRWSLKVGAQSQQTAETYQASGAPTKGRYGITVEGRHFSRERRYALSSKMYGTGLKGDMRDKIMNHSDKRLRDRIYFYVDKGTGINPERGVGGVQHKATLDNIYDLDSDPLRIWKGEDKFLDFESAVLDAGYSGYLARNNGSPASGVVIMLGDRNINVEQLSETDDPKSAKGVGAPAARPSYGRDVVVDAINANKKNFPMGAPTRARWAEILQKQMPEEYEALRAAGVFEGDQEKALYLSNLMTEFKNATETPNYAQIEAVRNAAAEAFEQAARRTSDVGHKRESSGRYIGAPDWVGKSPQQLAKMRAALRSLTLDGTAGRFWYEKSARAVMELVGGDKALAEKFIGLLAIFSQGTGVAPNTTAALKAWYQWRSGQPIEAGRFPTAMGKKASDWLNDGKDWGGIKTNNFYTDLMEEIDPSKVDTHHSTMDMWMAIAGDYGAMALDQGPKYLFMQREIKRIADEIGWRPHQVQAAIWTAIRARVMGSENERNAWEEKQGIRVKTDKGYETAKGREYDHFRAATRFGMAWKVTDKKGKDITQQAINESDYDFGTALRERSAQVSWEATPGKSTGVLPGIHTAPMHQQIEYLVAIRHALSDEKGRDLIDKALGLLTSNGLQGFSGWQGDTSVGVQQKAGVQVDAGRVIGSSRVLVNLASDIRGLVTNQEGVAWHYPVYAAAKYAENGVEITLGRQLTEQETGSLYQALARELGHTYAPPIPTETGFRVLNFPDEKFALMEETDKGKIKELQKASRGANDAFHKAVGRALESLPFGNEVQDVARFESDGELRENNWQNGDADYRQRIYEAVHGNDALRGPGGQDLLEWIDNDLRPRVAAVNADFAQRYGWDQPGTATNGPLEQAATARDVTQTPEFRAWFGDSKVVDANGKPLVVYHGTNQVITAFDPAKIGARDAGFFGSGFYFTPDENQALDYADTAVEDTGEGEAVVMPLYVSLQNPFIWDASDAGADATRAALASFGIKRDSVRGNSASLGNAKERELFNRAVRAAGHDGVLVRDEDGVQEVVAFTPTQIKSATGNNGNFDGADANVLHQTGIQTQTTGPLDQAARDVTQTPEFKAWFGDSKAVEVVSAETGLPPTSSKEKTRTVPLVMYHTTRNDFAEFEVGRTTVNSGTFGDWETTRAALFVTPDREASQAYGKRGGEFAEGARVMPLYVKAENPLDLSAGTIPYAVELQFEGIGFNPRWLYRFDWSHFDGEEGADFVRAAKQLGYDSVIFNDENPETGENFEAWAVFEPTQLKSATGNNGNFDGNDPNILKQRAFHGSPHRFDKFTLDHIGTGEGAQAYGWGLYFAGAKEVAEWYREKLSIEEKYVDGELLDPYNPKHALANALAEESQNVEEARNNLQVLAGPGGNKNVRKVAQEALRLLDEGLRPTIAFVKPDGQLYEVNIPEDDTMLLWDKPLSEQPEKVRAALKDAGDLLSPFDDSYSSMQVFFDGLSDGDKTGKRIYNELADKGAVGLGAEAASKYLNSLGISGIKYLDGTSRAAGKGNHNYVIFDDAAVEILDTYYQGQKQGPRGTFNPQTLLMSLGEASDLSTFLHESGHFFLEVMADIASAPDAPQDVVDDMNKVLAWFGVPDLATWNGYTLDQKRKHHEKWAESFEAYLFEGKAPSAELQPLFRRFRSWLVNVYKSLKQFMQGRDLGLNDDIRQVFDRMIATDAQIARAEEAAGMLPDFDATNEAIEKLQARSLRDLKWTVNARTKIIKAMQKQAAELRKGVEAEVRAEVEQQPVYKAMRWLKKGETVDPQTGEAVKAEKGFRLNTAALAELYPETMLARPDLTRLKGMTAKDGLAPDMIADMFGFESGDKLVREILSAEPIDSVIQGITDRRMLERHGELVDQRAIEEAANDAIHNEARARALATELKSQSEMMNPRQDTGRTASNGRAITVNALTEAAKQFGADLASRRKIRDLKSAAWQHRAAEARAGKAWQEHTAAGKTEDAVRAKRDQLLNNHAAKALQEAQVEARKVLEFFRRVTKDGNEKTVEKGRDPDVVNAMRAILSAYGIAPRQGKSALEYMDIMAKNDPAMHGALAAGVNAALVNAKPVDQMTMEELRGLNDEMRAMWHLAKRSRQMEVAGDLMDIEDAANELVVRMDGLGVPAEVPGESGAMTPKEKALRGLQHVGSLLRRVEQWAEGMDGKFGGPFLRLVFQPVKDAANRYRADRVKYRKRYQALVDAVGPHLRKGIIEAPELRYTFGKGHNGIGHAELLHAILHTGNQSNKRKLLLGRKWAPENADGTLDTAQWDAFINRMVNDGTLTKAHYDFAQGVWDLLEETKPLAQKAHRDVFGRYFAEVTADAFDTPFGQYRGGYVPAQADPRIVPDAGMRDLVELENENMMFSFPATNRGFTKSRTEYNRPLMLDLRTIGQHIDKVLLFAHMEPHVRDVNKLLRQKGVSYSLNRIDPTAVPGMLTPWLKRSARQIVETPWVGDGGVSRVASVLRNRAGMALMFANVSNAIQQVTGFSTAFAKLKADGLQSHMMRATAQFIANPKETSRNVAQASSFMEGRMAHEIAAINDAMDDILLDPNLYQKAQAWTRKHAYFLQSAFANTMEPIIWTAAYNAALEKGMEQDDAVRYADGLIRQTQGSTLPEDVSRAETGPAVLRMFTQFVGYFNMMANTNATGLKQIANEVGLKKGAGRALHLVTTGLLVPIWVAEAIAVAMRGGPEDEEDDGYLDDWLAAVFGFGTIKGAFAMVPVFGQAANAAVNRFNSNPADDRISASPAVSLLEAVAGVPSLLYKAMTDPDKINKRNAVRDVASAISLGTGLPAYAVARPLGYLAGVADERIEPTGPVDAVRGAVTGTPSPESR